MNTPSQYRNSVSADRKIAETIAPVLPSISLIEIIEQVAKKFAASLNENAIKTFNGRLDRGLELAKQGSVKLASDGAHPRRYQVLSSDSSNVYTVDLDAKTCDCPDSQKGFTCKHRVAAYYFEQATKIATSQKAGQPDKTNSPAPKPVIEQPKPVPQPQPNMPVNTPKQQPVEPASPTLIPAKKTPEQILKELGYEPEPSRTKEPAEPGYQLGSLYRRYLHGSDLAGQVFPVTIQNITKEKVMPHPSQPVIEKWCLTVSGLPHTMANKILFGARCEEDLVAIFGQMSIDTLKGKQIAIYPKAMNVAGVQKISIRFRSAK